MSGGVDSSVAASLLVEQGYDVVGIMLKLWQGEGANNASGCCNVGAAEDARRVAQVLGIDFYCMNFAERFEQTVVRDFHATYAAGQTPNPCVRCNQWIKFGALLERADALGADVLATGHYARVRETQGRFRLLRGVDDGKDQSYVLWMLRQAQLARCRFPVGEMPKRETRALAAELGLRTATKPDSQEICFVKGGDLGHYVQESIPEAAEPGPILDVRGDTVGEHRGLGHYTVGQRKGLGISLGVPVFVTSIDGSRNAIVVGSPEHLETSLIETRETSFVDARLHEDQRVLVQHRAHGDAVPAMIESVSGSRCTLRYERPVAAVAPGQSAAFYSAQCPDEILGGGIVWSTDRARERSAAST